MPSSISTWLQRRRARKAGSAGNREGETQAPAATDQEGHLHNSASVVIDPTSIPALPQVRRPLTPTDETLSPTEGDDSLSCGFTCPTLSQGPFFARLPYDIRRKILWEAFGGQRIHIDLTFDHPAVPRALPAQKTLDRNWAPWKKAPLNDLSHMRRHCNLNFERTLVGDRKPLVRDDSKRKQWCWYSSVCHSSKWKGLAGDRCHHGGTTDCYNFPVPDTFPSSCFIGVMGWLSTCRQAYVEGIDVLYSTNTIQIHDMIVLRHAPKLFVPHHWAKVKYVEIQWRLNLFQEAGPTDPPESDPASYRDLMPRLPTLLPGFRRLEISLQGLSQWASFRASESDLDRESATYEERIQRDLVGPMEKMLKQLDPSAQECSVAIPSFLYRPWRDAAREEGREVQQNIRGQVERHWRTFAGEGGKTGYWVYLGEKDINFSPIPCFGSGPGPDENSVFSQHPF